ncbi:DUF4221 family protein [Peijinzhouia sedimentorum]
MNILRIILLLSFGLFFFISCQTNLNAIYTISYNKEKIRIPIDSSITRFSRGMQQIWHHDGKEYYIHGDKAKSVLLFFDLESGRLDFKIQMERQGPNGVPSFNGFFVKSLDSVYVYHGYSYIMWHIDQSGEVKRRYRWSMDNSIDGILLNPYGEDAIFKGDLVYLPSSPNLRMSEFWQGYVSQSIDLETGEVDFNTKYSPIFEKGNYIYAFANVSRTLTPDGKLVYSFGPEDYLYTTDLATGKVLDRKLAKSDHITVQMAGDYLEPFDDERWNEDAGTLGYYKKILFDKYRNYYYRIVKLESASMYDLKKYSVIVLDEDLNVLGEVVLDDLGLTDNWFITSKGLCSPVSDYSPEAIENEILFYCYDFNHK